MVLSLRYWFLFKWYQLRDVYYEAQDFYWRIAQAPAIERRNAKRRRKWRAKYGYEESAQWAPGENILEHAAKVLSAWILYEWGDPPEFFCQTHNKAMHDEIQRFVFNYERYLKQIEAQDFPNFRWEIPALEKKFFALRQETEELEQKLYLDLANILRKYGISLWT